MRERAVAVAVAAGSVVVASLAGGVLALGLIGAGDDPQAPIAPALVITPRPTGGTGVGSPPGSATATGEPSGPGHSGSEQGHDDDPTGVPRTVETLDDDHG